MFVVYGSTEVFICRAGAGPGPTWVRLMCWLTFSDRKIMSPCEDRTIRKPSRTLRNTLVSSGTRVPAPLALSRTAVLLALALAAFTSVSVRKNHESRTSGPKQTWFCWFCWLILMNQNICRATLPTGSPAPSGARLAWACTLPLKSARARR